MDSFVLLAYARLAASRTFSQRLLACLNFTLDSEDLFCWCKWKKWFLWTMATAQAVFSIWCVRSHAHTPAHAALVWCVSKIARATFVSDTYCVGHWNEENERTNKNIKFNSWSFFFKLCKPFVSLNVGFPCMTSE